MKIPLPILRGMDSVRTCARVLLGFFILFFSAAAFGQRTMQFTEIPYSDPEIRQYGRGAEQWHWDMVDIPVAGARTAPKNEYQRSFFTWAKLEPTQDNYQFEAVIGPYIRDCINARRKLGIGIMTIYIGDQTNPSPSAGGVNMSYPLYVHNLMQSEPANARDWVGAGWWIPNYNSQHYLTRLDSLHSKMYRWLNTTYYNGVKYKDVISYIDVRGFGNWGEWHHYPYLDNIPSGEGAAGAWPVGRTPTYNTLKRIVQSHTTYFPDIWLAVIMNAFDSQFFWNTWNPPQIAAYILDTARNQKGPIGWRRDNWGDLATYIQAYGEFNDRGSIRGQPFSYYIMNKFRQAPVIGEPTSAIGDTYRNGVGYGDLENQVRKYGATSFGNGNYYATLGAAEQNAFRAASKAAGYRVVLTGGSGPSSIAPGSAFNVTLNWQNRGIAPVYDSWLCFYELRNASNQTVWSTQTNFRLTMNLQPSTTPTAHTQTFTLPANIAEGTYSLRLVIRDSVNFMEPFSLNIQGRATDGSYPLLANITVSGTAAANIAPTANAGADRTITLPTNTLSLAGSGSDPDGNIASYAWTQVSGPNTATMATPNAASNPLSGLVAGTYVFRLTVTDNLGATDTDDIQVIVNPAAPAPNVAPTANAGADRTITLPTSSVTLNGSGTDTDGTIASYAWTKVSGPAGGNIASPAAASTNITALTAGTYVFRLTVTDNDGATDTDDVQVTVNPAANVAPTANAGANRTITLPTSTIQLNGTATDTDGTIASYAWTKVSGPAGGNIQTPAAASTNITGLNAGTYVFRLTVTDNDGATDTDDVQVIVNPSTAPSPTNQAPVANAGADQTITLPTNSVTLSGSATDADGSIATYAWAKLSGPAGGNVQSPAAASTRITAMVAGTYVFRLTVTDNNGAQDTDDVTVIVNPAQPAANQAPIANAGNNITITLPTSSATLNGSGTDPDGTIAGYSWAKVSGPAGGAIQSATSASTNITGLTTAGTYVFRLTVRDNAGAQSTDDVQIVVAPAPVVPNQAPVANAGTDISITLPVSTATLNGSASRDADGTIAGYAWTKVSGPAGGTFADPRIARPVVSGLMQGTYVFELTVTDDDGARSTDRVTVTVIRINSRPVVVSPDTMLVTLPVQNTELVAVDSYDPDGQIRSFAWTYVSGPQTPRIMSPSAARTVVADLVEGTYRFQVEATDNDGAKGSKAVVVIVSPNSGRRIVPDVNVYPNPVSSSVNFQVTADVNGRTLLTFYDANGRPVMTDVFTKASRRQVRQVNISQLPRGTYFVQIQVDQAQPVVEKIVKY